MELSHATSVPAVSLQCCNAAKCSRNGEHEIDLTAELDSPRLGAIEIKATAALRLDSARHLIWLRDQLGERFVAGVVLHTGPRIFPLDDRIIAAPVAAIWS